MWCVRKAKGWTRGKSRRRSERGELIEGGQKLLVARHCAKETDKQGGIRRKLVGVVNRKGF